MSAVRDIDYAEPEVDQADLEDAAEREYQARGSLFADWFTNEWAMAEPELLLKLVTDAYGNEEQKAEAIGIAGQVHDAWIEYAVQEDWCFDRALARLS